MAANPAVKRAAGMASTQVVLDSGAPTRAAAKPKSKPAAPKPAVKAAAKSYTGMMSAPLNELSSEEQRVHDVAARRQSDAQQYAAYVMGQQGSIAGAAQLADQRALAATGAIQGGAAAANAQGLGALDRARAAQGIAGPVPSQQLSGVVDSQIRGNTLLGAASQRSADTANTNAGKAGFLKAAAQAAMLANQRSIAGDEYNQTSDIRHEKVSLLSQRDQLEQQAASDAAKLQADQAAAQAKLDSEAADRASRENIAGASISSRESIAAAGRSNARQLAKLRTSAKGGTTAAQRAAHVKASAALRSAIETGAADARDAGSSTAPVTDAAGNVVYVDKNGKPAKKGDDGAVVATRKRSQHEIRTALRNRYKDADVANAAMDLAILGHISPTNVARLKARHVAVPKSWLRAPAKAPAKVHSGASGSANIAG